MRITRERRTPKKPAVHNSTGNQLVLNAFITKAWEEYYSCIIDFEPGVLKIIADNDGDFALTRSRSSTRVSVMRIKDKLPKGDIECTLEGNVLTMTF